MSRVQTAVPSYLTRSVVAVLLFFPFGVPAVISAAKVPALLRDGDTAGAVEASDRAKRWSRLGLVFGVLTLLGLLFIWLWTLMTTEPAHPILR